MTGSNRAPAGSRKGLARVYVLEAANDGSVIYLDPATGALYPLATGLYWPADIALDPDGTTVYISEAFSDRLIRLDLTNCALSPFYTPGIDTPGALAAAPDGTLYVAARSDHPSDYKGAHICAIDPTSANFTSIASYIATPCQIEVEPSGTSALMATIAVNDLYCLRRLDLGSGTITEIAILPFSNRHDHYAAFTIANDNTVLITTGSRLLCVELVSGIIKELYLRFAQDLACLPFKDIALTPEGTHVLILAGSGIIRADLVTGEITQTLPQGMLSRTASHIALAAHQDPA